MIEGEKKKEKKKDVAWGTVYYTVLYISYVSSV